MSSRAGTFDAVGDGNPVPVRVGCPRLDGDAPGPAGRRSSVLKGPCRDLGRLPYAICGKTGYTTLAGNTLVTYARTDKIGLITVVLNGNKTHYIDTQSLLDFGFANFKDIKLKSSSIGTSFKSNLTLIPNFNEYTIEPDDNASVTLPNDADIADVASTMDFEQTSGLSANALCKIDYTYNGRPIGSVDILANKNANYETVASKMTSEIASTSPNDPNHTNTVNNKTQSFSNASLRFSFFDE